MRIDIDILREKIEEAGRREDCLNRMNESLELLERVQQLALVHDGPDAWIVYDNDDKGGM